MSSNNIEDGSKVIIRRDSYHRFEVVSPKTKVQMHKLCFFIENAIGCHYGTTFEVKNKQLFVKPQCINSTDDQSKSTTISGENNQFINDDGCSQKMSKEEIMALKAGGITGEEIISQLIENSESFDKKTEFSQEKYLKKKKKRHISEVTILKPTIPLVCEMLYVNSPGKIMDLRMDTVSQILTMANIQSNTNVMLFENTQSFLAGVILHRMGGMGNLIQLYTGDFPVRLCLPCFNLSNKDISILNGFQMNKINAVAKSAKDVNKDFAEPSTPSDSEKMDTINVDETIDNQDVKLQDNEDINTKTYHKALTEEEKVTRKKNRDDEEEKALCLLKKVSMDSLIIATKFHTKTVLVRLLEFLAPSRPFVVYSPYKEVLVECYIALKELQNTVLLNLTETWWRSYQVLPKRTHPQITMDGSGGYLLTGIKVDQGAADYTSEVKTAVSPTKKMKIG